MAGLLLPLRGVLLDERDEAVTKTIAPLLRMNGQNRLDREPVRPWNWYAAAHRKQSAVAVRQNEHMPLDVKSGNGDLVLDLLARGNRAAPVLRLAGERKLQCGVDVIPANLS